MKKRTMLWAAAVILAPATAVAQGGLPTCNPTVPGITAGSPFVWAFINNVCTDFSSYIVATTPGKIWTLDTPLLDFGGGTLKLHAVFNADPFISFGATTTNLSGTNTYAFLYGTPVVPGLYTNASSTGGVSVTDGLRGNTTVATSGVYPTYISAYGTVGSTPTNLGVDLGTAPCTASGTPLAVTTVCNQGTLTNSFAPTFYDNLEALLTYTQNDDASVASWSGAVTLTTSVTPEPAMFALFGTGLLVVGGFAVRRRKS
jgi:hypothetical protein